MDVCPSISNPLQEDADSDGFGDACDACPNDPLNGVGGSCGCAVGCLGGAASGDSDGNGLVNLSDFNGFSACLAGPGGGLNVTCDCFDFDIDGDSDLVDFGVFQRMYTSP